MFKTGENLSENDVAEIGQETEEKTKDVIARMEKIVEAQQAEAQLLKLFSEEPPDASAAGGQAEKDGKQRSDFSGAVMGTMRGYAAYRAMAYMPTGVPVEDDAGEKRCIRKA